MAGDVGGVTCGERLKELGFFSPEKASEGCLELSRASEEVIKTMEPGSSQWCMLEA